MEEPRIHTPQPTLPLGGLVCDDCPYRLEGKCGGLAEATAESFLMQDDSVIGCHNSARQRAFYVDLFGPRYPRPRRARHSTLSLPQFIPDIPTGLRQRPAFDSQTLFGVSLSTILRESGAIKFKSPEALRRALKLPADARLALIGTGSDRTIERFWEIARGENVWAHIATLNFEFATSMTYSVWGQHPRFDQIYNQDKNYASHDLLLSNGVPSIPFLFFYNERDYRRIAAWLRERTDVRIVAVLAQLCESDEEFSHLLDEMSALREDSRRKLQFLVVGPASSKKIKLLLTRFSNSIIVTHQPIFKAIMGQMTLPNLSHRRVDLSISDAVLAVRNVSTYKNFCARFLPSRARFLKGSNEAHMPLLSLD